MSRILTDEDLNALADILKDHKVCALGLDPKIIDALNEFTPEHLGIIKHIAVSIGKSANIVGVIVITGILTVLGGLLGKGFISTIVGWVKNG